MQIRLVSYLVSLILAFPIACSAQTPSESPASPREQLNHYIADLQKNPADDVLREKIIKLAQELKPPPAVLEEARRHFIKADTLAQDAHSRDAATLAINEYKEAIAIAPWWGEPYRNNVIMLEAAKRFDEAKKNIDFYLMTKPTENEARAAQDEKYKIEAKEEKAAQETQAAERERQAQAEEAERQRRAEEEKWGWLVGQWTVTRYTPEMKRYGRDPTVIMSPMEFRKSGSAVIGYLSKDSDEPWLRFSWSEDGTSMWESWTDDCSFHKAWRRINASSSRYRINWEDPALTCPDGHGDLYTRWSLNKLSK